MAAIDDELAGLIERPRTYDPREMGIAGAFVSLDTDGSLYIERGWVRAEDEPKVEAEPGDDGVEGDQATDPIGPQQPAPSAPSTVAPMDGTPQDGDNERYAPR